MPTEENSLPQFGEEQDSYNDYGPLGDTPPASHMPPMVGDVLYLGNSNLTVDSKQRIPLAPIFHANHSTTKIIGEDIQLFRGNYLFTIDATAYAVGTPICTRLFVNDSPVAFGSLDQILPAGSLCSASKSLLLHCKSGSKLSLYNLSHCAVGYKSVTLGIYRISDC